MDFNTNSILNKILGDKNVFFQNTKDSNIHIGDVIYNKVTKERSIKCPNCKEQVSEKTKKEEEVYYTALTCINCGHRFYERDEIADNISSYVDLSGEEAIRFKRLIEAVNHDLHAGEIPIAYQRCSANKEVYGRTPQIYEWGAFTLFLTQPVRYWVDNSLDSVLAYLEKSRQLDPKSESYDKIAASIASRYCQGLMRKISNLKSRKLSKPLINKKEQTKEEIETNRKEYQENLIATRKEVFSYLFEIENCYQLYPDIDFLKIILNELYGYKLGKNDKAIAWFRRRTASFLKRPKDDEKGEIRLLKGYVFDYHKVKGNCDDIFTDDKFRETPSSFAVKIEARLKKADPNQVFPEIRVGKIDKTPLSALAALRVYAIIFYILLILTGIILIYLNWYVILSSYILIIGAFFYLKWKDKDIPDELRRLINSKTNRF